MFWYTYKVDFTILNIAGNNRYKQTKEINASSEKIVRQEIKRNWYHSKPRIIKITQIGGKHETLR